MQFLITITGNEGFEIEPQNFLYREMLVYYSGYIRPNKSPLSDQDGGRPKTLLPFNDGHRADMCSADLRPRLRCLLSSNSACNVALSVMAVAAGGAGAATGLNFRTLSSSSHVRTRRPSVRPD